MTNLHSHDLLALPSDCRLVRVGPDKRPLVGKDWFDRDNFTPDEAATLNGTAPPAWGVKTGPVSGQLVLDLDAPGWRESFEEVTGHPITDLPRTIGWTSGKPGRSGHLFTVPNEWWRHLANRRSFTRPWREGDQLGKDGKKSPVTVWELRWDRHQSVVKGAHPETDGYHWLPGRSPHDISDPAVAPDWLLDLLLVQEHPDAPVVLPTAEDADRAVAMLEHIDPAAHSTYSEWLRVGMALHHTDPGLLTAWVEWSRPMAAFDEAECLAKWDGFGKGHKGRPASIATLHHLAKAGGYREPRRQQQGPAEMFRDEAAAAGPAPEKRGAQGTGAPIDQWEAAIRAALNPDHPSHERNSIRRQINAATLAAELGLRVSPAQTRQRILQIQRAFVTGDAEKGTAGGERARIKEKEWLVDGLIARGCLTGIAAFNKVGKTKMAARLAADLIFGRPFLGRFPVAPGGHRIVLWWVDQPAADSAAYLRAVGLMEPDGTLHPQIVRLYTEEDDLAWDDAGADLLLEHAAAEPGLVLITDSFFHSIQRIYGSDQEPEAGGALIDVQTLLAPYGVTHVCLFHSPKDTGPTGIQAIRGHGSAGGAVSACISLHFMEKRCPLKKLWIADKENPHRRMVVEGRAPLQDLLIRGDFERGTFEVVGEYQRAVAELLADERQAEKVDGLTEQQRRVLEALGGINDPKGATVQKIASAVHGTDASTRAQKELIRKQCKAMVLRGLLREADAGGMTLFAIRPSALTG